MIKFTGVKVHHHSSIVEEDMFLLRIFRHRGFNKLAKARATLVTTRSLMMAHLLLASYRSSHYLHQMLCGIDDA